MEYVLLILLGLVGVWVAYYLSNRTTEENSAKERQSKEGSRLKVNMPGYERLDTKHGNSLNQDSLDFLYAQSHGMWICRHCETINNGYSPRCIACSAEK